MSIATEIDRTKRIVYAGTADFAVPPLQALLQGGWNVVGVFTQPDRPSGRGKKVRFGPIKQMALDHGIEVHQPVSLKDPAVVEGIRDLQPDLMIVVAYGLIIPIDMLQLPPFGCINIHGSILPRWRGAAPIQRAIEAGDGVSGVSIMQMDEGLDTGPILSEVSFTIPKGFSSAQLHDVLAAKGAEALMDVLPPLFKGEREAVQQSEQGVTYAHKLEKSEAKVDWSQSADVIWRRVLAFNPWPIAYVDTKKGPLRIHSASIAEPLGKTAAIGTIIHVCQDGIDVQCGDGVLRIESIQLPGKKMMTVKSALNGYGSLFEVGAPLGVNA